MIENIDKYANVHYINVGCEFKKLNEAKYLLELFKYLKSHFPDFFKFNFYIISSQNRDVKFEIKTFHSHNILIFISDEHGYECKHPELFLKVFKSYGGGDLPFPLGCVGDVPEYPYIPIADRTTSVFFSGNLNANRLNLWTNLLGFGNHNIPARLILNRFTKKIIFSNNKFCDFSIKLSKKYGKSIVCFNNGFKAGFSPNEYGRILSDSKIVLSPKGFNSTECFRTYEALRAGCVVISEKLPDNYLYKDSPIIQINDWKNIKRIIKDLLDNPSELINISERSRAWYIENLSEVATANRIIAVINNDCQ